MILDDIVADKIPEIEARKHNVPLDELKILSSEQPPALDFTLALKGKGVKLIAEVKKASPSRGVIRADFNPVDIALTYAGNGASAISVLTDNKYFQGSLDYLREIKKALEGKPVPLLRKDFILDEYQVYESRANGADALLLIVAVLDDAKLETLLGLSHRLGMGCLVEVHSEAELETALKSGAGIIGINNRDLKTFEVDLNTTRRLKPLIPDDKVVVSESGIKNRGDLEKLAGWGVDAVLIGESLVASDDIAAKMKELL